MAERLKLRGVSTTRGRLASGAERIYYRHRATGVMLGTSDDHEAVLRSYQRICDGAPTVADPASEDRAGEVVAARLVSIRGAAGYCGISVPEFRKHILPKVRARTFGSVERYDLREIDAVLDRRSRLLARATHARATDGGLELMNRREAAAFCKMSQPTFDRRIRPLLKERRFGRNARAVWFLRRDIVEVYARVFGVEPPR